MLFYLKKHPVLELAAALLLGGGGMLAIRAFGVPAPFDIFAGAAAIGVLGGAALGLWNGLVQAGYRAFKGRQYADRLTAALAVHFAQAHALQVAAAFLVAAGEEIFFRGFIQGKFGPLSGAAAFMLCHIG